MKKAFTMAEILISLTIIGVIAAITLPSLKANINEKVWATQKKALYSRMSQAISMMPSLNGYGEYEGTWDNDVVTVTKDTAAARFVTDGLAKVLNINNICTIPMNTSSENARKELKKCGIPEKITNMANSKLDFPTKLSELNPMFTSTYEQIYSNPQHNINTNAAAFETKNGESIAVFYNPYCQPETEITPPASDSNVAGWLSTQTYMCANFIYDFNGVKGPNKVGKDIGFITALYTVEPEIVAPMPLDKDAKKGNIGTYLHSLAMTACRTQDQNSRLPNKDELTAMYYNKQILGMTVINGSQYWSSSLYENDSQYAYAVYFIQGFRPVMRRDNYSLRVRCVKR